jgi:hypothetical protein
MTDDTEGMLIAHSCLLQALISALIARKILPPGEVTSLVGEAEEFLAGLLPQLMTPNARDYARRVLQAMGQVFSQPHD